MADEVVLGIRIAGVEAAESRIAQMIADAEKRFEAMFNRVGRVSGPVGGSTSAPNAVARRVAMRQTHREEERHQQRLQANEARFAERQRRIDEMAQRRMGNFGGGRAAMTSGATSGVMAVGSRLAAAAGGLSLPAMAARGLQGTVEGGMLSNQWKALEREVAGIAKPVVDRVIQVVAAARARLERMNPAQQDMALNAGIAVSAAGIGYAAGGLRGGVAGLGVAGAGYVGSKIFGAFQDLPTLGKGEYEAGKVSSMNREELGAYGKKLQGALDYIKNKADERLNNDMSVRGIGQDMLLGSPMYAVLSRLKGSASGFGAFGAGGMSPTDTSAALAAIQKEYHAISARNKILDGQDPNFPVDKQADAMRRRVMSADTIGYGAAGSTAQMVQEKMLLSGLPGGEKSATTILSDIYKLMENNIPKTPLDVIMNKVGDKAAGTVQ